MNIETLVSKVTIGNLAIRRFKEDDLNVPCSLDYCSNKGKDFALLDSKDLYLVCEECSEKLNDKYKELQINVKEKINDRNN